MSTLYDLAEYYKYRLKDVAGLNPKDAPEIKFLVVGPGRSGFALLIKIINMLIGHGRWHRSRFRQELRKYLSHASVGFRDTLFNYFINDVGIKPSDLFISGEFHSLTGGPKWLSRKDASKCSIRKYIGIRGMGDMSVVISMPKQALDVDFVAHSHYYPASWVNDQFFGANTRYSSVRNPLDIIVSSMFSINAIASEYIQRNLPDEDEATMRLELGRNKLSDINFIGGVSEVQMGYFTEYLMVRDLYHQMRFEDLISNPADTILGIAKSAGVEITEEDAQKMWDSISFRSYFKYHKHNYWRGRIGNWREFLINEHLEMIKNQGLDKILVALGYDPIEYIDESNYTESQVLLRDCVKRGVLYEGHRDKDLQTFAFNKSNIKADKYDFIKLDDGRDVEVERSGIKDEKMLRGMMDAVADSLSPINTEIEKLWQKYGS